MPEMFYLPRSSFLSWPLLEDPGPNDAEGSQQFSTVFGSQLRACLVAQRLGTTDAPVSLSRSTISSSRRVGTAQHLTTSSTFLTCFPRALSKVVKGKSSPVFLLPICPALRRTRAHHLLPGCYSSTMFPHSSFGKATGGSPQVTKSQPLGRKEEKSKKMRWRKNKRTSECPARHQLAGSTQ